MGAANEILNHWGPALLVCLTVVLGLFFQNGRISDLKDTVNQRFNDLRALLESEIRRLDQRIDRLESPIARR